MKKFLAIVIIAVLAGTGALYIYRYRIIQYTAEGIIRNALPKNITVDRIKFEFSASRVIFYGVRVLNPEGFSYKYMLEVGDIICDYKMKGSSMLDGIEILDPVVKSPELTIERLGDSRVNIVEAQEQSVTAVAPPEPADKAADADTAAQSDKPTGEYSAPRPQAAKAPPSLPTFANKRLPEILKLPERMILKGGKIMFVDRFVTPGPHAIALENINASLSIKLDEAYSRILLISSEGSACVNGNRREEIKWDIALDPMAAKITMSNRFYISDIDILNLEPYYDRYSPFIFKKGKVSGTLVFDFDNGSIGSTNELHLSDLAFSVKREYENARFWDTTVNDLARYFTTPFGDIVFDFKIKGELSEPRFYLGPISKRALTSMAIDKISSAIEQAAKDSGASSGEGKSDIDKARDYIDMFKGLIKKA